MGRLVLRFVRPASKCVEGVAYEEIAIGDKKPAYVLVVKGAGWNVAGRVADALSESPAQTRLSGSPVIAIPEGSEFEVWEVE